MHSPRLEESWLDNPLLKGVLAGALAAKALASTTAFAPIGVVGATGWSVVYLVAASTTALETLKLWRGLRYTLRPGATTP